MSWATEMKCTPQTILRYIIIMKMYIAGATPDWFVKKFGMNSHTVHTIVSAVRTWLVNQYPDKDIPPPSFMRIQYKHFDVLLDELLSIKNIKLIPQDEWEEYLKNTTTRRPGRNTRGKNITVRGPKNMSIPTNKHNYIANQMLEAASEIAEGNMGDVLGVVVIAVTNDGTKVSRIGLDTNGAQKAIINLVSPQVQKEKKSLFSEKL